MERGVKPQTFTLSSHSLLTDEKGGIYLILKVHQKQFSTGILNKWKLNSKGTLIGISLIKKVSEGPRQSQRPLPKFTLNFISDGMEEFSVPSWWMEEVPWGTRAKLCPWAQLHDFLGVCHGSPTLTQGPNQTVVSLYLTRSQFLVSWEALAYLTGLEIMEGIWCGPLAKNFWKPLL